MSSAGSLPIRSGAISAARTRGASSAGTVSAAAAWLVLWQQPTPTDLRRAQLGDREILLGEEDLEMLDEELEFYGWLEEQPEFANVDSVG